MSASPKPIITEMPIMLEPAFPIFSPRPLKEDLNRQTANVLFVNTSPFKLIFKIVPSVAGLYSVRPEIDYLPPRGCRFIAVSMSEKPHPKKEHDFTYKVCALNGPEGFGLTAAQYWEQNKLESDDRRLQEAQFICVEPEMEAVKSIHTRHNIPGAEDGKIQSPTPSDYLKRVRRRTSILDQSVKLHAPPKNSPAFQRKRSRSKGNSRTDSASDGLCNCLCADPNRYFWQDAAALRSFIYGFVIAFTLSGIMIARKN